MRFVTAAFLALLLWGYASFSAGDAGLPKWIPAAGLLAVGVMLQLVYVRLVNSQFDAVGMPQAVHVRLRNDRGVVPFWIAATGIVARSFMIAGVVLPLFEAAGCIVRGTTSVGP